MNEAKRSELDAADGSTGALKQCPSCGCKRWRRVGSVRTDGEDVMRIIECMRCETTWNEMGTATDCDGLLKAIRTWRDMPDAEMRLRAGEMTAQEIRSVRAVLGSILSNAKGQP